MHIADNFGWEMAGYWEALWRLSLTYLMFITTTLSLYYLPRLAELSSAKEIIAELQQGFKIIMPVIFLFALLMYTLRGILIKVLFSSEFEPVVGLFTWQVVGDFFKICNWLLSFVMLTKSMSKSYIFCEFFISFGFYFVALVFSRFWGIDGVIFAYAVVNFIALFLVAFLLVTQLKRQNVNKTALDSERSSVYQLI
jgi:PST family polysaccharide transporter